MQTTKLLGTWADGEKLLAACACTEGAHDWQAPHEIVGGCRENPGVWSHGAGIVMHHVCEHCGCGRITDTGATDRHTGRQGLESVRYVRDYRAQYGRGS